MTARTALACLVLSIAAPGLALGRQAPPPPPAAPPPAALKADRRPPPPPVPAPAPPRREGQPVNVRIDVTITDQRGGTAPVKKSVSVVTADNMTGYIRTEAHAMGLGPVPLNVDAEPLLLADGKIRLKVNLQYDLPASKEALADLKTGTVAGTSIHENLELVLVNGQSVVAAQSSDPIGDRQVTVEVKATVMR